VAAAPLDLPCEGLVAYPGESTYYSEKSQGKPKPIMNIVKI
jgi:hypothetical protein